MLPFVLNPFIPVPVEESLEDASFDRVFGLLGCALLVQSVTLSVGLLRILGVHRRNKCDPLTVRRPNSRIGPRRNCGQLLGFPAADSDQPELIFAGTIGLKQDGLRIGAPARMAIVLRSCRQLPRLSSRR